jgi:signal peptidase I
VTEEHEGQDAGGYRWPSADLPPFPPTPPSSPGEPVIPEPESPPEADEPPPGAPRRRYLATLLVGLAVAVAGGVAWGLVVKWTGRDFGFLALFVGILVGVACVQVGGKTKAFGLQATAVVMAAVGVLVGKYLGFAFVVHSGGGVQFGEAPPILSSAMFTLFRDNLHTVFGLLDLLWFGGAVALAALVSQPEWPDAEPAPASRQVSETSFDAYGPPVEPVYHLPVQHSRNPIDRLARRLPQPWRTIVDWTVTIAGAIAIVLLIKAYVVNPYRIPSSSMEPTLHCARPAQGCEARFSDRILANRFIYRFRDPRRGEIVVFNTPPLAKIKCGAGGTFVKRIIGLPGETLQVRVLHGAGYVFINGRKLIEPYIQASRRSPASPFGPVKIANNNYFMMGDNRAESCDSRFWGTVPRKNIIGKVFLTYWPPNRLSFH